MSATTDKTDMEWSYDIPGDDWHLFATIEPGSLDEMAIVQAKLFDHAGQVAELEEIYRNNASTSPLTSSSMGGDDSHVSFGTAARLREPSTFGSAAPPHGLFAGPFEDVHSRQYNHRMAVFSLPIAHDHEAPLPDGKTQEYVRWSELVGGYEELFPEDVTMDPRLTDGNSDASCALQSNRNLDDQPPQPPSAGPTISDLHSLTPVSSPRSSASKPTSPSRKLARNRPHKCKYPGCTRKYDRISRSEACSNRHQGAKPRRCEGGCGNPECDMSFISMDQLRLHEKAPCPHCKKAIAKRNMRKHRDRCSGQSSSAAPGLPRTTRSLTRNGGTGTPASSEALQDS